MGNVRFCKRKSVANFRSTRKRRFDTDTKDEAFTVWLLLDSVGALVTLSVTHRALL
jgi:hypothetical protein